MGVRRARPALHLANEACSVGYSGGHPLLRALLRALVARKRGSRPDRPPRGDQPLQAETGPPAAWHNVATRWERPAFTGPSCSACESRQLTARGTLARVVLLVFLRLVMRPRTRLCRMVVWSESSCPAPTSNILVAQIDTRQRNVRHSPAMSHDD